MRHWLHTMLLKGIFGGAADTILAAIRKSFADGEFGNPFIRSDPWGFPHLAIGAILRSQGKDPEVNDEFIDSLLYTQYEDRQAFVILALLAPNLDYKHHDFHKDHLHPASIFKKKALIAAGVKQEDIEFYQDAKNWNSVLNLGQLDANENMSKQDQKLVDWVAMEAKRQVIFEAKFCSDRQLPAPPLLVLSEFRNFISERRKILGQQLRELLR